MVFLNLSFELEAKKIKGEKAINKYHKIGKEKKFKNMLVYNNAKYIENRFVCFVSNSFCPSNIIKGKY